MGKLIIERNQCHLAQAHGSPFTDKWLEDTLGKYGERGEAGLYEVLDSDLSGYIPETAELLEELSCNQLPKFSSSITLEDFIRGIKIWREYTSTSPSGRSLSHYHAFIAPKPNDRNTKKLSLQSDTHHHSAIKSVHETWAYSETLAGYP